MQSHTAVHQEIGQGSCTQRAGNSCRRHTVGKVSTSRLSWVPKAPLHMTTRKRGRCVHSVRNIAVEQRRYKKQNMSRNINDRQRRVPSSYSLSAALRCVAKSAFISATNLNTVRIIIAWDHHHKQVPTQMYMCALCRDAYA